jgi:CheY-like chemotaxis protein
VGGLRVLVIDDNRDSADSATDVLRLLGNQVECAYDGASGVGRGTAAAAARDPAGPGDARHGRLRGAQGSCANEADGTPPSWWP